MNTMPRASSLTAIAIVGGVVVACAAVRFTRIRRRRAHTASNTSQQSTARLAGKAQHNDPRFFAAKDEHGLLPLNPRFLDSFLRWECGRTLLGMNLFPNAQEITESMACLAAITEALGEGCTAETDAIAVVIGDGRTPRTAALLAMRTKWQVVSIDPALDGLQPPEPSASVCDECAPMAPDGLNDLTMIAGAARQPLPKELRHPKLAAQEQHGRALEKRAAMRASLASLARLFLMPCTAQSAAVHLTERTLAGELPPTSGAGVEGGPSLSAAVSARPSRSRRSRGRPTHEVMRRATPQSP